MRKRKPSAVWVVFAYLIPLLVVLALGVLTLVLVTEEPARGTGCKMLGETIVRKQDGSKLQCIKNVQTGKLFWKEIETRK